MQGTKYKYQTEYENSTGCFWEKSPASYVKLFGEKFTHLIDGKNCLDLGCGEGKNSVYLASFGANIIAVDISKIALSRFKHQPNYEQCKHRIVTQNADITTLNFPKNKFDIVVAYGIFHCLNPKSQIFLLVNSIKNWIKPEGFFIGSTFTDELPIPNVQEYLSQESLLKKGELQVMFNDWEILFSEDSIITETHPTSKIEHQHSLTRIITQKHD